MAMLQSMLHGRLHRLATQVVIFKRFFVKLIICAFKIVKQLTPGINLADQTVARAVIFLVGFQMCGQHFDFACKYSDLYFAGTGVTLMTSELFSYRFFINLTHNKCFAVLDPLFYLFC